MNRCFRPARARALNVFLLVVAASAGLLGNARPASAGFGIRLGSGRAEPVRWRRPYYRPYAYTWHGGFWRHGWHDGRIGWWWVVGPSWYFYSAPVYPYPAPVEIVPVPVPVPAPAPAPAPVTPSTGAAVPPPPPAPPTMSAPASPSASAQMWFKCASPEGYYPYVQSCPGGWLQVPAAPAPTVP